MDENKSDTKGAGKFLKVLMIPGEKLADIMGQWRGLSDADKQWYRDAAAAQGLI